MGHQCLGKSAVPRSMLVVEDLWPPGCSPQGRGWCEQVQPGVSVLVDESGEAASRWLAVLAGQVAPQRGRVQCAALCSQADAEAYAAQVYWHRPPAVGRERDTTAAQWLQTAALRWPLWSDTDWRAHCSGFELESHLDKPLWHLSTGCVRKLGIAAALASGARLTLIEEPVAGLDSNSIRYLSKALDRLGESIAHDQQDRWVLVAHWEPLAGVTWDEVITPPVLHALVGQEEQGAPLPLQQHPL